MRLLRQEFDLLSRLRHPGIATVYELGFTDQGIPFLVSEFIEGPSLHSWWLGKDLKSTLARFAQLLGTLDFLHRRDVIHCDIKPEHLIVSSSNVRLVDFGLATICGDKSKPRGTPGYMAPEVLEGETPTAASDLYAVGIMLFQYLWGRLPFEGSISEVTSRQLSQDIILPSGDITEGLRLLIEQLLARNPMRRPVSAAETLTLLEGITQERDWTAADCLAGQGLPMPVLVGREHSFERVEQLIADFCQSNQSAVHGLMIVGHQGQGRSRFCEEVIRIANLHGLAIQRGLGEFSGNSGSAFSTVEPAAEQAQAIRRAIDFIRTQAWQPLLLVLDDLQHSLDIQIILALHRLEDIRLFICVTTLIQSNAEKTLSSTFNLIELDPLDEPQTIALVHSMLKV